MHLRAASRAAREPISAFTPPGQRRAVTMAAVRWRVLQPVEQVSGLHVRSHQLHGLGLLGKWRSGRTRPKGWRRGAMGQLQLSPFGRPQNAEPQTPSAGADA